MFSITSPNNTWDQTFLANYVAINIEDELARIPGIGAGQASSALATTRCGSGSHPISLAKLQLTVADLEKAIAAQNVVNPAGKLGASRRRRDSNSPTPSAPRAAC